MSTETLGGSPLILPGRQSIWRTAGIEIIGLLLYVAAVQILVAAVDITPTGTSALVVSLILAGVPAVLWMAFFYAQDRVEPEPLRNVVLVAAASALLAGAVGQPLITKAFGINEWITRSTSAQIIGSILVVGFIQEACKYAAIRATVYESDAITQRVDGVVYGAAAGVGYATALNVSMVLQNGGFTDLRAGVVRIVATALTHGSLGAFIGYLVGRNRLEKRAVWIMPLGLAVAAAINGLSVWLRQRASITSASFGGSNGSSPNRGLLVQAVIAVALLAVVLMLARRSDSQTIVVPERGMANHGPLIGVVVVVAVALLAGLVYRQSLLGATRTTSLGTATVAYPSWWRLDSSGSARGTLSVRNNQASGFPSIMTMTSVRVAAELKDRQAISAAADIVNVERGTSLTSYKVFDIAAGLTVNGHSSARSEFVYTSAGGSLLQQNLPVVVTGRDTFIRNGDTVYVMSLESAAADQNRAVPRYRSFVNSARFGS